MSACESLINAAAEGKLGELKKALARGADPDCRDESNRTSLHWACQEGKLSIVKYLLKVGASVDAQDNLGFTPLVIAAAEGGTEIAGELLKEGASPNTKVKSNSNGSALHSACAWGHLDIVKLLSEHAGVELSLKDDDGFTPLAYAKKNNHREISNYLIAHGAR